MNNKRIAQLHRNLSVTHNLIADEFMKVIEPDPTPQPTPQPPTDVLVDGSGNEYRTVKIGNQIWQAENMRATHYADGTPIDNIKDVKNWANRTTGCYAYMSNQDKFAKPYGCLYNAHVLNRIAPSGWRVPTDEDFQELERTIGLSGVDSTGHRGDKGGRLKAKGLEYWNPPNEGATDDYGFSAVGAGDINAIGDHNHAPAFYSFGRTGWFWTTSGDSDKKWIRGLPTGYTSIFRAQLPIDRFGLSVRLVKV